MDRIVEIIISLQNDIFLFLNLALPLAFVWLSIVRRNWSKVKPQCSHRNAAIKYSHHFYQYRHTANTPKSRHGNVDFSLSKGEDVTFAP